MTLQKLSDFFIGEDYKFEKLDYLYLHDKDDFPQKKEIDFDNFFFVTEVSNDKVKVMGIITGQEKEINFSNLKGNWWFIRIPEIIRKNLL